MYQDDRLQELLWMNRCVDTSSFYISKWRDQVEITHTHIVNPLPVYEFKRNKDELKLVSPKDYEKN